MPTNLIDVRLGDVGCGQTTSNGSQITCTLTTGAAAGTYATVEVLSAEGVVPVDAAVVPIVVALSTTNVTPNIELNQAGGDILTITGMGMPQKMEQVSVTFSDNTACQIIETSDT